jgi:hypothetical protein
MAEETPELSEKDFINESYQKDPFPFWFWLFVVMGITALVVGGSLWYSEKIDELFKASPFLRVTNREMSLFLWDNPEFMRANVKVKNGYLPDFEYLDRVGLDPDRAEEYAVAPPELIFRYHTWYRLLGDVLIPQPIPKEQFLLFIQDSREWQPEYWPKAPKGYVELLKGLAESKVTDLSTLPEDALPKEVRQAFQGWQHFFYDGEALNKIHPSKETVEAFLTQYPHYARNYWFNIVKDHYPDYLKDNEAKDLTPFTRAALYNFGEYEKKKGG